MKLAHHSAKPIKRFNRKKNYRVGYNHTAGWKPRGFWISDEDDYGWKEWCKDAEWNNHGFAYSYEVEFTEKTNVLCIHNLKELDDFAKQYGCMNPDYASMADKLPQSMRDDSINWDAVAEKYDGILITPYRWERRLEPGFMWYYGWDCASGCIWNLDIIKKLKLIDKFK